MGFWLALCQKTTDFVEYAQDGLYLEYTPACAFCTKNLLGFFLSWQEIKGNATNIVRHFSLLKLQRYLNLMFS